MLKAVILQCILCACSNVCHVCMYWGSPQEYQDNEFCSLHHIIFTPDGGHNDQSNINKAFVLKGAILQCILCACVPGSALKYQGTGFINVLVRVCVSFYWVGGDCYTISIF